MPEPLELFADLDDPRPLSPTTPELRASVQERARQIRRQRFAAVAVPVSLVAAGVVALLVIVGLPANRASVVPGGPTTTPSAVSSPTTGTARPTVGAFSPLGSTGTRSEVPWAQVGPGWFLVTSDTNGKGELYLTNPDGGRYAIASLPLAHGQVDPQLADWSGDGRRALLMTGDGNGTLLTEVDLHTGDVRSQHVPQSFPYVSYSRPEGAKIVLAATDLANPNAGAQLYKLAWGQAPVVASPIRIVGYSVDHSFLYTADGTEILLADGGGLNVVGNDGHLVRKLAFNGEFCSPVKLWDPTHVLVSCIEHGLDPSRLWLLPLGGGDPTDLTPSRSSADSADLGDLNAWVLPTGRLYLHTLGACGTQHLAAQAADGSITLINAPGGFGNNLVPQTAVGPRIAVLADSECGKTQALLWIDPATGHGQTIATGGIGSVLPWDATLS